MNSGCNAITGLRLEWPSMKDSDLRARFLRLPPDHQDRLLVLSLFEEGLVDLNVLGILSEIEGAPARFLGVSRDAWEEMLESGAREGLAAPSMAAVYRTDPGLPALLAGVWQERAGGAYEAERDAAEAASLRAFAVVGEWLNDQLGEEGEEIALEVLEIESPALAAAAGRALDRRMFLEAQSLLEPLIAFLGHTGHAEEARAWTERGREVLEAGGSTPGPDTPAGSLWFFLVGAQASRLHREGHLDEAEARYETLRGMLARSGSEWARSRLAATLHQLGTIARARGDAEAAESLYRSAHEILESLGEPSVN